MTQQFYSYVYAKKKKRKGKKRKQAQIDTCTPIFTAALFTVAKRWK